MESDSHESAWQVHQVYTKYEINALTLMIRNRKTKKTLSISPNKESYLFVHINGRTECYHRVIALQFIPNPYPTKYTEVNHKNHIRNDNRIEKLEWVTPSANRKDRQPYTQTKKRYTDELPEGSILITQYKGYSFNDYYLDPSKKRS